MIKRINGVQELFNRLYTRRDTLGIKGIKLTPTKPVDEKFLPCIFMSEGTDSVIDYSGRASVGYPCKRVLEITVEIVGNRDATDIYQLYRDVRSALFEDGVRLADKGVFIQEIRTEGPSSYGLQDIIGMGLVLGMFYVDDGS